MNLWQSGGWVFMLPWVAGPLGQAYATSGRVEEGVTLLQQSADHSAALKVTPLLARDLTFLSEAYLSTGRLSDAARSARRAMEFCQAHKQRLFEADALRISGEILARQTPVDVHNAQGSYLQALTLATELGMRPLVAHCHLGLGTLCRRTGDRAKAEEHLMTAARMYREMDMSFWLARAEAALTALA